MSTPEKKNMKKQELPPTQQKPNLSSLPDELLVSCIARVSRLYYPTLSLVSKSFRSLLTSPELYKARSLLGNTESCLYVCLESSSDSRWFTLCRKPDLTLTNGTSNLSKKKKKKKKSRGYVLAKVPILHSPRAEDSGLVAVGSDIYNIGSRLSYSRSPSSTVSILDCRSHTWREAPSLKVELMSVTAFVLDQKIYAVGRSHGDYSSEVFHSKTQTWEPVPIPCLDSKRFYLKPRSTFIEGKYHVTTDKGWICYNSKEGRWYMAEPRVRLSIFTCDSCEIDDVLYQVTYHRELMWYDTEVHIWRSLKGLVGLPKSLKFPSSVTRLVDYGGKMAVLWVVNGKYEKMIWRAEIALERRRSCEIWGKVEWVDHVLTVPKEYDFVKVLVATI